MADDGAYARWFASLPADQQDVLLSLAGKPVRILGMPAGTLELPDDLSPAVPDVPPLTFDEE